MAFCIPKHLVNAFLDKLKTGEITPDKLIEMGTEGRNKLFTEMFGEQGGKRTNALFESKLLLKSQQKGITRWAEKITGMKPDAKRDILSKVDRMENILGSELNPKTAETFLGDLANQRVGTKVTMAEASNLTELSKNVMEVKEKFGEESIEHGTAIESFLKYVRDIKLADNKLKPLEYANPLNWGRAIMDAAGAQKSAKASTDLSFLLRQGLPALYAHNKVWRKGSNDSLVNAYGALKGKDMEFVLNAKTHVRPLNLDGTYKKFDLALGVSEEAHPPSFLEKIPGLGRVFKASEVGFATAAREVRLGVFDSIYNSFKEQGFTDAQMQGLGKYANSFSGRGDLGVFEPSGNVLNVLMFSARYMKSSIDGVTGYQLNTGMSKAVRLQALKDSGKVWGGIMATLGVAQAVAPGSVEWNPQSSDFGKIYIMKDGERTNTRVSVAAGYGSIITLAARLSPMIVGKAPRVKSSVTGISYDLNDPSAYKGKTAWDLGMDFLGNKKSPFIQSLKMLATEKTYEGDPLTPGNFAFESFAPILMENVVELYQDPRSANIMLASMLDFLGAGTANYGPEVKWHIKTTKHIQQLGDQFASEAPKGEDKEKYKIKMLKQASKDYNDLYVPWIAKMRKSDVFKGLTTEQQWDSLRQARRMITETIYDKYLFEYEKTEKEDLPYNLFDSLE